MLFQGIAAAPGLVIAQCLRIEPGPEIAANQKIKPEQVSLELERFAQAVRQATGQLEEIAVKARNAGDEQRAEIITAQSMMLSDPMLDEGVREKITTQLVSAVQAVQEMIAEQAEILLSLEDEYIRERAADVQDVGQRLVSALLGRTTIDLSGLTKEVALVAHEITPSQMATADASKARAIVAEIGGKTSHTAILANNMGIPAVLGCQGIMAAVTTEELLLVDGGAGTVETGISAQRRIEVTRELERLDIVHASLLELRDQPTRTLDGVSIELAANIMDPAGAEKASELGADGIGLYRTEFLFMDRTTPPTEEEQLAAYIQVFDTMRGKPVIIRTMDIGGDKTIPYLNLEKEANPFLGYRAIRICLRDTALFTTQLRAILRAAVHGKARIMYPMISSLEEIRAANMLLRQAKESLRLEGIPFDDNLSVGIMVEIPSAAVTADLLIGEVDFFSIGSNDLTQYALAVDRMNENVNELYNPFQPGVLRLIRMVAEAANRAGGAKFAGMCGELAADPKATLLLLGLGLTEFSVNPASLLRIKKIITSVELSYARKVAETAMKFSTAAEIVAFLQTAIPDELQPFLH
jgi:phosphotransferase system enzyme I (PtsI)